jgi:hypothetical protein
LIREDYESPIPEDLRWQNWAADEEGVTGDDLLELIDEELFPTLTELEVDEENRRGLIVRSVFADSYNYMKSGTLLRKVINKLEEIDFTSKEERHVFNDVYEQILRDLQSAGNAAEYYTATRDTLHGRNGRSRVGGDCARPGLRDGRLPGRHDRAPAPEGRRFGPAARPAPADDPRH